MAGRRPIDDWLAQIGAAVYAAVAYRLALIGHEVSGDTYAKDLQGDPPRPHRIGYLNPGDGGVRYLASDL